jgi:hypothetical protein
MDPITARTPKGTAVGSAKGIVHLFDWTYADRLTTTANVVVVKVIGMCGKVLRGKPVIREGDQPTCQECVDERDYRAAETAGFEHRVRAVRRPLGHSRIAGNNAMRYGAQVDCYTCPAATYDQRTIWYSNESGQKPRAEEIARQHFLTKYREHLAAAKPASATSITPSRLTELRAEGLAKVSQFVDPHVIARVGAILDARGEAWAAAVLGRDISRRSLGVPNRPYLRNGDEYTLVAADIEEDRARFAAITETGDDA